MNTVLTIDEYDSRCGKRKSPRSHQFEFHVLRSSRDRYELEDTLFSLTGTVLFVDIRAVRMLAHRMSAQRDLKKNPRGGISPAALYAMGLIDEIFHYIVRLYEQTVNPEVFGRAYGSLGSSLGVDPRSLLLEQFVASYPPTDVYREQLTAESYLGGGTLGKRNIEIVLEEIIHIHLSNSNPAFGIARELFNDRDFKKRTPYDAGIKKLEKFFAKEKKFGPTNQDLFTLLRAPILANPHSLEGQLEYIRKHWGRFLSESLLSRMKRAGDLMREEFRAVGHGGPGPTRVPRYSGDELSEYMMDDAERFTPDIDWMPNVVLLAKNTYVWLDQLSKKYKRHIATLDQIPDEELDQIGRWHFTGLWLIGIWERSRASQRIKQMTGNPEAVASAYSLFDYDIASDLGGDSAFQNLRHRAWQRGIRLAGDMVPNHVGIYSRWVIEHPEYFIQTPYPPFPSYRFTGADLSDTPGIELRLEDGYWSRTDAAVVFQRIDRHSGQTCYIYHGNDGTNMPWNDTAQLNFLRQEVREAVIGSIFHVARKFSIIRFDAAMVLAKKHFQRLWYPEPGTGGAIPSRADHALTRQEIDQLFPVEFWREVVDRINRDLPETLLLAEAFWLLEGYFVRTLGMHRVYNSAFMHMLMNEENDKFRALIRNTLHYNPEILKRYVNFMSNPDEKTAVEQFGKGDKYFGIATMMVTIPGLPMFAHGQIDGFGEKYGMEYRRAYHDEQSDWDLVRRHEHEIFPLMHKRHLFSQVMNFELYDAAGYHGGVDENVFAYSNQTAAERAFVCYNNRYGETDVWIAGSVGKVAKENESDLIRRSLANVFGFRPEGNLFYIFKDFTTGMEYLRSGRELCDRGFFIHLRAYECHVFLDIQEVWDRDRIFVNLSERIGHNSVPAVWRAARELQLSPVHQAFAFVIDEIEALSQTTGIVDKKQTLNEATEKIISRLRAFSETAAQIASASIDTVRFEKGVLAGLKHFSEIFPRATTMKRGKQAEGETVVRKKIGFGITDIPRERLFFGVRLILEEIIESGGREIWDGLQLDTAVLRAYESRRYPTQVGAEELLLLKALTRHLRRLGAEKIIDAPSLLLKSLGEAECAQFIQLHEYEGNRYYRKESLERLLRWFTAVRYLDAVLTMPSTRWDRMRRGGAEFLDKALSASDASGYRLELFKSSMTNSIRPARRPTRSR